MFLSLVQTEWLTNTIHACLISISLAVCFTVFPACGSETNTDKESTEKKIENTSHLVSVSHAIGFDILSGTDSQIIYLYRHYENHKDTLSLKLPQKLDRLIVMATPYLAMIDTLDALDKVIAISDAQYLWNPEIKASVEKGKIRELGSDQTLDIEAIVALEPDILIVSAFPGGFTSSLRQLRQLGIQILPMAEWQETSLLGRAEWIKLVGALVGKPEEAMNIYKHIVAEYEKISQQTKTLLSKPSVLSSLPYKGLWSVPGGDSYMGKLFVEAGADYNWQHTSDKGSIHLDFEAVYPVGVKTDYWLISENITRLSDLIDRDSRFADFRSVQGKNVYHSFGRSNPSGGNDYWESGVINPHLILADVVKILHPGLLPEHRLIYFAPLK